MKTLPVQSLIIMFAALLLAAPAGADAPLPLPNVGSPLLLRLEGVIEPTPEAARPRGFTVVSLGFLGESGDPRRFIGVEEARTVGGDHPLDGKDVLAGVSPFNPQLLVTGPPELIAKLRDAPPGTTVRVEGLTDRGSRTYYLRAVELETKKAKSE